MNNRRIDRNQWPLFNIPPHQAEAPPSAVPVSDQSPVPGKSADRRLLSTIREQDAISASCRAPPS